MDVIREKLMMKIYHPTRFEKYMSFGYDIANEEYIN
jgi:hypothetical protein